jgi:hypothetical protein
LEQVKLPILFVTNVGAALNLERPTAALATRAQFSRENDVLKCTIWTPRGRRALAVTGDGEMTGLPVPKERQLGEVPRYESIYGITGTGVEIMGTNEGTKLVFSRTGHNDKLVILASIPIGESRGVDGFATKDYPFVALTKNKLDFTSYIGTLLIDVKKLAIVASIDVPVGVKATSPQYIISSSSHALLILDTDLSWMQIVDLLPLKIVPKVK